jgi:NAD(P)H-dependent FMN reductase
MSTPHRERPKPVHIVGLSGSLREGSYTGIAVRKALEGARAAGATTEFIDLRDYSLVFNIGSTQAADYPADITRLRKALQGAQGIILGTPEYHGSFSGVLKNALDLMGFDEFEGKMIGLVGVSGGAMGAFDALNSLRTIGRALHAWVVPDQASIPEAWKVFEPDGTVKNANLEKRLLNVGSQVARFATLHSCEEHLRFLREWEKAQPNPGAEKAQASE